MPARTTPANGARMAAQRAFFDTALSKAGAPTAPQATTAPRAAAAAASNPVQPAVTRLRAETTIPQEAPTRILRPGSLIDIKV